MPKKKKLKKKKPQKQILLSEKEEKLINSILDNLNELNPDDFKRDITDPRIARALLEKLPLKEKSEVLLVSLVRESFEDKDVQKTVKKISFKLKQKGFYVSRGDSQDDSPVIKPGVDKEDPEAYLGPFSMSGDRAVLIMIPRQPRGIEIGLGVVNYFKGIVYFLHDLYSKKQSREIKKFFFEQTIEVIETTIEHACDTLEKAYKSDTVKSGEKIAGYMKLRPWIKTNVTPLDRPAIYESINLEEVTDDVLTREKLSFLFEDECMATWILDPNKLQPVIEEIIKVDSSPIVLTEDQKNIRINEIKGKAMGDLFPDSMIGALKDMLEEMAYFFLKQEKEEKAGISLVSALELEKTGDLTSSLFLKFLMERSISFFMTGHGEKSEEKKEKDSAPTIITP